MAVPIPPFELKDHCAVIYQNVLYVFSPAGFMSLPLKKNAKWSRLPMGTSVTGAACFMGYKDGDPKNPAFYVVGGTGGPADYLGIQNYSFLDKTWKNAKLDGGDIKNRINHDAIYLDVSGSILVFAGATDGNPNPSVQTFTITLSADLYHIESHNQPVPPSTKPVLLPWPDGTAIVVGGSADNKKVYQFINNGWKPTEFVLGTPLGNPGTDLVSINPFINGGKSLQVFDVGTSPTKVRSETLKPPGAASRRRSIHHASRHIHFDIWKRGPSPYPTYNATLAPTGTRNGAAIAFDPKDPQGKVVIAGGSAEEPIVIFDQSKNEWLDAAHLFSPSTTSSSTSSSATSTMTSTSSSMTSTSTSTPTITPVSTESSTSTPIAGAYPSSRNLTIIGATLGSLLGIGAIVIIVLLLLAWRRRSKLYGPHMKEKHFNHGDGDRLSFQDAGITPLTRSVQPIASGPVPSTDSWAFISRQAGGDSPQKRSRPPTRGIPVTDKGLSPLRMVETQERPSSELYPDDVKKSSFGAAVDSSHVEADGRLTDEGWSKYFQDDKDNKSLRSTVSSMDSKSDYRSDHRSSGWPHASAQIAPLSVAQLSGPQPLGKVSTGSPSTEHPPGWASSEHQGMTAKISNADSISINSDDYYDDRRDNRRNLFSSDVPSTIFEGDRWGMMSRGPRVASSNYSNSVYLDNPGQPAGVPDRYLTPKPHDSRNSPSQHTSRSNNKGVLSSDISWLNIGNNR